MDESNKRYGQFSDTNQPSPSTAPPPVALPPGAPGSHNPPTGYHPTMGYPPAMGYPPSNPAGYPNPISPYDQQQHYPPPPRPEMYYAPTHYNRRQGSSFVRGVLSIMILLTLFVCVTSIIMWLIMGPRFPAVHVDSLQVANFNVATDNFTSTWEANITIENKYWRAKIGFDRMQSFIYFENDELLASSFLEAPENPITVNGHDKGTIHMNLSTNDYKMQSVPHPGKRVMEEMRDKRKTGTITFLLEMFAWSNIDSGLFSTRARFVQFRMSCSGLKVDFEGDSGNGKMHENSNYCEIDL